MGHTTSTQHLWSQFAQQFASYYQTHHHGNSTSNNWTPHTYYPSFSTTPHHNNSGSTYSTWGSGHTSGSSGGSSGSDTVSIDPGSGFLDNSAAIREFFNTFTNQLSQDVKEGESALGIVSEDERFTTLLSLVETASLTQALTDADNAGPVTILAPTEEAFAALPAEDVQILTENPDLLAEVLQAHVSAGEVTFDDNGVIVFDSLLDTDETVLMGNEGSSTVVTGQQTLQTAGPALRGEDGSVIIPLESVILTDSVLEQIAAIKAAQPAE